MLRSSRLAGISTARWLWDLTQASQNPALAAKCCQVLLRGRLPNAGALLSAPERCQVLPSAAECYRALPSAPAFSRALPSEPLESVGQPAHSAALSSQGREAQALTTQGWATSLRHSRYFVVGFRVSTEHDAWDKFAKSLSKGCHTCQHAILVKSFSHTGPFAVNACMPS